MSDQPAGPFDGPNTITPAQFKAMTAPKEEEILSAILDYLVLRSPDGVWTTVEPRGGFINGSATRKVYAAGVGVPDIVGCLEGRFVGIEVKTAKGSLRKTQEEFRDRLQAAGGFSGVCRSIDDTERFINSIRGKI